jgi:hypothetical protein
MTRAARHSDEATAFPTQLCHNVGQSTFCPRGDTHMSINEFESVAVIDTRDKKLTSMVRRIWLRDLLVRPVAAPRSTTLPPRFPHQKIPAGLSRLGINSFL